MDGQEITALELHGSNGSVITKPLTESGVLKKVVGYKEYAGQTMYNSTVRFENIADKLEGCTSFIVTFQLIETGVLATPGDATSEITMHEHPQSFDNTIWILSHVYVRTGVFNEYDADVVYPKSITLPPIIYEITIQSTQRVPDRVCTITFDGNDMILTIPSQTLARREMYHKFKYTIYGA